MVGTTVLVVEIVGVFPHIKCQQRLQTFLNRIGCICFLRDDELAICIGR